MERDNRNTPMTTTIRATWIIRGSLPRTESRPAGGTGGCAAPGAGARRAADGTCMESTGAAKQTPPARGAGKGFPCRHRGLAQARHVVKSRLATRLASAGAAGGRTGAGAQHALEVGVVLLRGG